MLSKFRSRDEEQFPPRKKNCTGFQRNGNCGGYFPRSQQYIFFRARQPYISELNNEVDLRAVSRITCAKYSHKIIEWIDKSAAKDSSSFVLETKLWFSKSSEASEFHGRSNISLFPSNRPLCTPQCRVCLSTISLSFSPAEGHFGVETRLAMIHVCTSNENAYQERQVSYLRGIFDGLKWDLGPTRKNRDMRKTQEYTFEVVGRFVFCDGIY